MAIAFVIYIYVLEILECHNMSAKGISCLEKVCNVVCGEIGGYLFGFFWWEVISFG